MNTPISTNPRSQRVRSALQKALRDLLQDSPYDKITITSITKQAGLARHTFYNHYESKDDLMNAILDSILMMGGGDQNIREQYERDPGSLKERNIQLFRSWKENSDLADFARSVDIEALLTCRFREQLLNQFFASNLDQASDARLPLTDYMITLHSYAFVGVLLKWLREGMSYPPEVMGEFLHHFIGIERKRAAVERFKDVIR